MTGLAQANEIKKFTFNLELFLEQNDILKVFTYGSNGFRARSLSSPNRWALNSPTKSLLIASLKRVFLRNNSHDFLKLIHEIQETN